MKLMKSAAAVAAILSAACLSAEDTASRAEKPFVVCSFNMRTDCGADKGELTWTNRLPRILKIIESHKLDVIGAQS